MKIAAKVLTVFVLLYVLSYFLVMARNVPAVDKTGKVAFRSSFRMAHTAGRLGPLTIEASEVTVLNYIFYPMDKLYYAVAPNELVIQYDSDTLIREVRCFAQNGVYGVQHCSGLGDCSI